MVTVSVGYAGTYDSLCLAPHAPLSSSLTPIQQFSILLLQFIYCPEQTLLLLLFNILLTSSPWKSPFFSLSSCFTVAQDQLVWPTGISPLSEHQLYLTLYHPLEGCIRFWQSRIVEPTQTCSQTGWIQVLALQHFGYIT